MERNHILNFRVNDQELAILKEKAKNNGMSVSNYLRTLGLYSSKLLVETKIIQLEEKNEI